MFMFCVLIKDSVLYVINGIAIDK